MMFVYFNVMNETSLDVNDGWNAKCVCAYKEEDDGIRKDLLIAFLLKKDWKRIE